MNHSLRSAEPMASPTTETPQERGARRAAASFNFTLKLVRPGFGPAAELPTPSPA